MTFTAKIQQIRLMRSIYDYKKVGNIFCFSITFSRSFCFSACFCFIINELMYWALLHFTPLDYRVALAIVLVAVLAWMCVAFPC